MNRVSKATRHPWPLTRWLIWATALLRGLAYPFLIITSLATVGTVAQAAPGNFWSAQSYGGVMLAGALSGLALALVRLGDGRFETEKGKNVRRDARHASGFWLASFIAACVAILLVTVIQHLPATIETPWLKAKGATPPACMPGASCPRAGTTASPTATSSSGAEMSDETRESLTRRTP